MSAGNEREERRIEPLAAAAVPPLPPRTCTHSVTDELQGFSQAGAHAACLQHVRLLLCLPQPLQLFLKALTPRVKTEQPTDVQTKQTDTNLFKCAHCRSVRRTRRLQLLLGLLHTHTRIHTHTHIRAL